ncbi:MAG: helix-turn-helix transcriptional regulator [Oscillospiraceae bacterium]|nr:helix-turn-helix transcriptional regulator [Oscillospiraceae bacterium]
MYEWHRQIQIIVDEIDECIKHRDDEALTLRFLSRKMGYSEFHTTRKFKEISGMQFRNYLRLRRLAFALIEVRDSSRSFLDIAVDYGFSSHEAFTRAFKQTYGITPKSYRKHPKPVILRTKIKPFDCYLLGIGEIGMIKSTEEVKIYYVTIPAHKFMHIKNYESDGYFDFWEKQSQIPGQDGETIEGLLDSITGKLDGKDDIIGLYSGQIMAHINESDGRVPECYGIRLAPDYNSDVPKPLTMVDVPEAEYIVFEHGPFSHDGEGETVGNKTLEAIANYDYTETAHELDNSPGRMAYFYYEPDKFYKHIKPVRKK